MKAEQNMREAYDEMTGISEQMREYANDVKEGRRREVTTDCNKVFITEFNPEFVDGMEDFPRMILSAQITIAQMGEIAEVDFTRMRKRLCEAICESVKLKDAAEGDFSAQDVEEIFPPKNEDSAQ